MVKKKVKMKGSKNPWFRERQGHKKGWSFVPINWKGWLSLAVLIILNVFAALYFDLNVIEGKRWAKFGVVFLLSILVFILIAQRKTQNVSASKK